MSFDGLHALLWLDHRIGICRWRELAFRRLRVIFLGGCVARDFESAFRQSAPHLSTPEIPRTGMMGDPMTGEMSHPGSITPVKMDRTLWTGMEKIPIVEKRMT